MGKELRAARVEDYEFKTIALESRWLAGATLHRERDLLVKYNSKGVLPPKVFEELGHECEKDLHALLTRPLGELCRRSKELVKRSSRPVSAMSERSSLGDGVRKEDPDEHSTSMGVSSSEIHGAFDDERTTVTLDDLDTANIAAADAPKNASIELSSD